MTGSVSMSLDGFVGPEPGEDGSGVHERLHRWMYDLVAWRERQNLEGGSPNIDSDVVAEEFHQAGAYLLGRNTFDLGEERWGEDPPFRGPVFVVTHRPRPVLTRRNGTVFAFVTEGFESAVAQAKSAANGMDVLCTGGPDVLRQGLSTGLLDELQIHMSPVVLGGGVRLFDGLANYPLEFTMERVIHSGTVTHLRLCAER
ncbi:dihydrofolate reductase family protein [Stackebrandtia albiflava]|uniref:dihydrofolate reductase family protein n=1 Tax=Stackebrandtia albiflava TaxID=406432 RepID=UPI001FCED48D|nr:dihydrofolate reductase family protein [Stackebrandtia albiflava]